MKFLSENASASAIEINPVIRDSSDMEIWGLLYEEFSNGRSFRVSPEDNNIRNVDAFVQENYGLLGFDLLGLSVSLKRKNFGIIWALYKKWMIERVTKKEVLELFRSLSY